uniref:aspartyl/asparaginyl beta-hydroxylase n=1 Tax=Euleptes europaea TaxID=460621 RepID=UPI00253FA980|nr:aspartyl/asparaginyl beta-hydroxylase [Euleptes europaea]
MAPRKNPKGGSPAPGARRETKHGNKNGKKEGVSGSSFFTWFMVIALLGVWTSVAVVWFELVDYEEVLGKLGIYDADGDGDFDVDDAKILLGKYTLVKFYPQYCLTKDGNNENIDSLEEVLNILAEESSDWFYGFLSFLYDVMTPFEIIEEEESETADDVDAKEIKEPARKEKQELKKESKDEEKKKLKRKVDDLDKKDKKAADKAKKDKKAEKERSGPDKSVKNKGTAKELRLKERSVLEHTTPGDAEEVIQQPADQPHIRAEHRSAEPEPEDEIQSLLREALNSQLGETDDEHEETQFQQEENNEIPEDTFEVPEAEEDYEREFEDKMPDILAIPESYQEEPTSDHEVREPELDEPHGTHEYDTDVEENTYEPVEPVEPDARELTLEDALVHETEAFSEDEEQQDYVDEHEVESEDYVETQDTDGEPVTEHYYEVLEEETLQDEADAVETTTEHSESDEREHEKDHVDDQPHETGQGEKEAQQKEKAKKKKPKLFNKFDKGIKAELEAAEKLRKKGKAEDALKAFETLVNTYPQSPRARYGKAQSEDDLAEKMRSNEMLQRAVSTYGEVASLPSVPDDLVKLTLKRRADRQQFLGRMRGSLVTLQKLVSLFPNDTSFKNNLGVGYLLIGDNSNAKKVYEEVLNLAPNDGFAKVHYGFILKAENKIAESIPYLKEGLESGDPGTDDGRFYFHLGDAMQRVGNKEAYKWYELGHQRGHFASVWQRSLYNVKGIKAQPWWAAKETGYTELVKSLERNWKVIRDEGLAVMDKGKGLFLPEDENLREKGDWSQFTLWQQGRKNDNACKSVPKTCALLERFPEATGCRRGQIKYSVMHPGTHVWPHTGPTNCRLRMHLGLVIPKEGCRIRCAEETRSWEEGKVLIFDDSFEHEVWQGASTYRLIFIVDVWHPELTAQQRRTLPAI